MTASFVPDWVQDAVFYQIFPDRFATSARVPKPAHLEPWDSPPTVYGFKGGDLLGVAERLDYLSDLGVTAIYFTPIFASAANHRYHTYDYHQVDPILGGNTAFREMLDACHDRGIRVVLDGVFNHASRGLFQFHHILENGPASPYVDWFHINGYPLHAYGGGRINYGAWWNLPALPKFNTDTPAVREYLLGVGEHWVRQGIDGWRLDVPMEIDDEAFWQAFRRRVKTVNAEAYIVGEIWDPAPDWLRGDRFDAVMNYVFSRACLGFCGGDTLNTHRMRHGPYRLTPLGAQALSNRIDAMLDLYDWPVMLAQLNLLGSHDTPRTVTLFNGDTTRLKLAFFYQMTAPGAPCIYYGDEVGLTGGGDPACRKAMPWDESQWDAGLRDHVRRCVALRHRHPALRRGDYTRLYARRGVYAFARRCEDETLVVVLNNDEAGEINIPLRGCLPNGTVLRPVWPASDEVVMVERGRLHGGRIAARSGAAWSVIG